MEKHRRSTFLKTIRERKRIYISGIRNLELLHIPLQAALSRGRVLSRFVACAPAGSQVPR